MRIATLVPRFQKRYCFAVLVLTTCSYVSLAAVVSLDIDDASGAPFPNVLVIVKSLDEKREVVRQLTDNIGNPIEVHLGPGLYRLIATCPYGMCQTGVKEFLVGDRNSHVQLRVNAAATRDNRAIIGSPTVALQVLTTNGTPVPETRILIRNADAQIEEWHTTDATGKTTFRMPGNPTLIVIPYQGSIVERQFAVPAEQMRPCNTALPSTGVPYEMSITLR